MMVVVVMTVAAGHYDEAGRIPAHGMMMVVMMVILRKLDIFIRRGGRP